MTPRTRSSIGTAWLCFSLLLTVAASAQQKPHDLKAGYDPGREVNLVGSVTTFVAGSETGPSGAHVTVQTAAGLVDVHVGTAKFLQLNHLTLTSGDTVRVVGESFTSGSNTVFLARIVQKGTQAVAVRSPRGMPLWLAGARIADAANQQSPRGAL
jgi:hypothetical protein